MLGVYLSFNYTIKYQTDIANVELLIFGTLQHMQSRTFDAWLIGERSSVCMRGQICSGSGLSLKLNCQLKTSNIELADYRSVTSRGCLAQIWT